METNQQATQNETDVWFEVQRIWPGGNYGWITISDHDTREQADDRKTREEASHPGVEYKIRRVRGTSE